MKRPFGDVDGGGQGAPAAPGSMVVTTRLLCRVEKTGSLIGKGGDVIKSIRNDTGARVKVEDTVPGEKERLITVSSAPERSGAGCPAQEALQRLLVRMLETEGPGGLLTPPEQAEACVIVDSVYVGSIVGKGGSAVREMCSESGASITVLGHVRSPLVSPQQQVIKAAGPYPGVRKALDLVLAKIRDCVQRGVQPSHNPAGQASAGMPGGNAMVSGPPMQQPRLMHQTSVGSMVGGGMPGVSMAGGSMGMAGAARSGMAAAGGMMVMPPGAIGSPGALMMSNSGASPYSYNSGASPYSYPVECVYRMLMPDSRVGALIGKAGEHLKRIRTQTGGEIHVEGRVDGLDHRMVTCRSTEPCDAQTCGAGEALLRCVQFLVSKEVSDADRGAHAAGDGAAAGGGVSGSGSGAGGAGPVHHTIRIVTGAKQLGAVIGVKGSTIRQLAADSKARLSVEKDTRALSSIISPTDEVLLVEGLSSQVMSALRAVAVLLRGIQVKHQADAKGLPIPPALATMLGCTPTSGSAATAPAAGPHGGMASMMMGTMQLPHPPQNAFMGGGPAGPRPPPEPPSALKPPGPPMGPPLNRMMMHGSGGMGGPAHHGYGGMGAGLVQTGGTAWDSSHYQQQQQLMGTMSMSLPSPMQQQQSNSLPWYHQQQQVAPAAPQQHHAYGSGMGGMMPSGGGASSFMGGQMPPPPQGMMSGVGSWQGGTYGNGALTGSAAAGLSAPVGGIMGVSNSAGLGSGGVAGSSNLASGPGAPMAGTSGVGAGAQAGASSGSGMSSTTKAATPAGTAVNGTFASTSGLAPGAAGSGASTTVGAAGPASVASAYGGYAASGAYGTHATGGMYNSTGAVGTAGVAGSYGQPYGMGGMQGQQGVYAGASAQAPYAPQLS